MGLRSTLTLIEALTRRGGSLDLVQPAHESARIRDTVPSQVGLAFHGFGEVRFRLVPQAVLHTSPPPLGVGARTDTDVRSPRSEACPVVNLHLDGGGYE